MRTRPTKRLNKIIRSHIKQHGRELTDDNLTWYLRTRQGSGRDVGAMEEAEKAR
jgi:hypothetical protein